MLFGLYSVLLGYVMWRPRLVPRPVGASLVLSGLGWLTFLVPPVAAMLLPGNVLVGALGEAVVILWLLVMGVNSQTTPVAARMLRFPLRLPPYERTRIVSGLQATPLIRR